MPGPSADESLCWQGAWFAEFVFLYYRITIAALSVLVGSSANAQLCLVLMALATAGLLAFVLLVKPYDDGSHTSPEMLTSADKAQAHSLGATLVASAIGFVCLLSPGRRAGSNVLAGLVVGVVGVTPLAVGLYEQRKASKEEEGDGSVPSDEGQGKDEEKAESEPEPESESEPEPEPEPEDELETTANPLGATE